MQRVRDITQTVLEYLLKKIFYYDLGICVIVGISFLFTRGFSYIAYSDRMVYAGLGVVILGGFVVLGNSAVGKDFGIPGMVKKPSDAKRFLAHNLEMREALERRYDVAIQIWLIGICCIGIAALVQVLLAK